MHGTNVIHHEALEIQFAMSLERQIPLYSVAQQKTTWYYGWKICIRANHMLHCLSVVPFEVVIFKFVVDGSKYSKPSHESSYKATCHTYDKFIHKILTSELRCVVFGFVVNSFTRDLVTNKVYVRLLKRPRQY